VPVQHIQQQLGGHYAAHYPAARYELNYTAPDFLTVPEERAEGEAWWAVLGRELFRAGLKALGLALASWFDKHRLGK